MKVLDYDLRVIKAVKALRMLRNMKQAEMADALGVERSVYSRIENGEICISFGQLHAIASALHTSVFQIIAIADADQNIDFKMTSLSDILVRFVLMSEERGKVPFSEQELEMIICKIKALYSKGREREE